MAVSKYLLSYVHASTEDALQKIHSSQIGISEEEAKKRLSENGLNTIKKKRVNVFSVLLRQITSNPLTIILGIATAMSFSLGEKGSAYYIFGIITVSILLGFYNEFSAEKTVEALLKKISSIVFVFRDDEKKEIPASHITIGDIVFLTPGTIIPADVRFISSSNLEVDESVLTGESTAAMKHAECIRSSINTLSDCKNIGFMGTSILNGSAKGVVIGVGKTTEYGKIAEETTFIRPITEFQKGLAKFGQLIIRIVIILTVGIFVVNAILGHSLLTSLLFALAIAVGLTPELLPVIVTISLSHGAGKLAKKHVVAKRLIAIENLGNMDILCTDKTGTLTEGKMEVKSIFNSERKFSPDILRKALLCNDAIIHNRIIGNSIDVAIWQYAISHTFLLEKSYKKIVEEPYDFQKKVMFSIIEHDNKRELIIKGIPEAVLDFSHGTKGRKELEDTFTSYNKDGIRVVAVASKPVIKKALYDWKDIHDMQFDGFIALQDMPKSTVKISLKQLKNLSVHVKVITGDNEIVAQKICDEVGLAIDGILTGKEMDRITDVEFHALVEKINLFTQVSPEQKLRIIQTLQRNGHTVGYMGDGINDVPSLHAADVGISVNDAIDVAKDAAAIVLLQKSLRVITDGIMEGRKTFNNTIKYILMATSSNFGNMFSAAGASFFLPFLPMTPVQILLTNSLYDVSQVSIPSDNVDSESLVKPRHWDIKFLRDYMLFFGPISSLFDFLTFGVMLFLFHARGSFFQTGWFIESIATEILVIFVIRTSRTPFFRSRPSKYVFMTAISMVAIGLLLPFLPIATQLGLTPLPALYFIILLILIVLYLFLVESVKTIFLRKYNL